MCFFWEKFSTGWIGCLLFCILPPMHAECSRRPISCIGGREIGLFRKKQCRRSTKTLNHCAQLYRRQAKRPCGRRPLCLIACLSIVSAKVILLLVILLLRKRLSIKQMGKMKNQPRKGGWHVRWAMGRYDWPMVAYRLVFMVFHSATAGMMPKEIISSRIFTRWA